MHFEASLLYLVTALSLAQGSAIPNEQSPASPLAKRANISCPGSDGDIYTGARGKGDYWRVRCGRDCPNQSNVAIKYNIDFEGCINACSTRLKNAGDCTFATFTGDINTGGTCYLKDGCGGNTVASSGVKLAAKIN